MKFRIIETFDCKKTIALFFLILGAAFLFQPFSELRLRGFDVDVCLKGISLVLLIISAILSSISCPRKLVELVSAITLVLGYVCLIGPPLLEKFSFLQSFAFHLLVSGTLAFAITTTRKKTFELFASVIVLCGLVLLFQPNSLLKSFALPIILANVLMVSIVSPRKTMLERFWVSSIAVGLFFMCQPFWMGFYNSGFQILLSGTTGFVVISHR
ncbi:MAG: hypothetical protein VX541_05120 [Candidatus Poribacteria bacterium]|nr:hypothetical protein [Candidatus Poribacteria bacterium]